MSKNSSKSKNSSDSRNSHNTATTLYFDPRAGEQELGAGVFGKVAKYTIGGVAYAVKRSAFVEHESRHGKQHKKQFGYQSDFLYEYDILRKMHGCTGILTVEGIFFDPSGDCYIMTELMDITLADWYERNNFATRMAYLPEIIRQVGIGMACLHHQGYIHNDFKDDNVLLSLKNGKIVAKICDFGKAWLAAKSSRYHGIEKVMPIDPMITRYDDEKWALAVVMTNVVLGRDLCHTHNKKIFYSNYALGLGFDIEGYLRKSLQPADFQRIPQCYWLLVKPIFRSMHDLIPDLRHIISQAFAPHVPPTDSASSELGSNGGSAVLEAIDSFKPYILTIKREDVDYKESAHFGLYMQALASYIGQKMGRRLTDKELEALYLIFGRKAPYLFSLESEAEVYFYQAQLLALSNYQVYIQVV